MKKILKPRATIEQLERIESLSKNVYKAVYRECLDRFFVRKNKFFSMRQATLVIECLEKRQPTDVTQGMEDALEHLRREKLRLKGRDS